jgi:hypothetical protein
MGNFRILLALGVVLGWQAKADNVAYMGTSTGQFGTVDLNTGQFNLLGSTGLTLAGLASLNGTLYGTSYNTGAGTLYSINPANGNLTTIGNSTVNYDLFGCTATQLYALDANFNLYYVSPVTGEATLIGATGVTPGGDSALSANAAGLYLSNGADFYSVNTTTGAATLIGVTGGALLSAMVGEGGVLYGGEASPNAEVDTINTATGIATASAAITGGATTVYGLAPYPLSAAPEPSTLGLLGAAAVFCLGLGKSGKAVRRNE